MPAQSNRAPPARNAAVNSVTATAAVMDNVAIMQAAQEAILAASECRAVIGETYQVPRATPPGPNGWGCENTPSTKSKYVAGIATDDNGAVTITMARIPELGDAAGRTVLLTPLSASGQPMVYGTDAGKSGPISFACGPGGPRPMLVRQLPPSCRDSR